MPRERIRAFVREIWHWYAKNKRHLPWRDLWHESEETRAYKVLVSEVMLQQTQVPRVKVLFPQFLEKFPTVRDLAAASNRDVILAWRGMGYNRRALKLRDAARIILEKYYKLSNNKRVTLSVVEGRHACHGSTTLTMTQACDDNVFPRSMDDLLEIPGIGPYTAAAIRNFAFNIPTPCIDTNIRRVLHRRFIGSENPDGTWKKHDRELLTLAEEVLDVATTNYPLQTINYPAADWHHALMDYGSLVEVGRRPNFARASRGKREPGRFVGSYYIPNRIFRGKIVESLRDISRGLTIEEIGERTCSDWDHRIHRSWLTKIIEGLQKDSLVTMEKTRYVLQV